MGKVVRRAKVVWEGDDEQLEITTVNVRASARVPGLSDEDFKNAAREAEQLCPVLNALRGNVEVRFSASAAAA